MPASLPANSVARFFCKNLPAIQALRDYTFAAGRADLLAGLSVAAVAVPQAMAYAIAAGVPAEYGLYTAIVMTAVGALFASSKQLINGPTNVISIAVLSALAPIPAELKLASAFTLALLVGVFQTLITLLRLGDLTRYISHSVVVGFTTGASLLLVIDQTRNLFGWSGGGDAREHFLVRTWHTWTQSGSPHLATTMIGIGAMVFLLALRAMKRRLGWLFLPELLVTVIVAAFLVAVLRLDQQGVQVVGAIPSVLPSFAWPKLPTHHMVELSESALAIATLGLLEALAMAKHLAAQTGENFDLNQQCLSEGLANITGSLFHCIPGSGSLTRSAINHQAGARTQWSGIWSAAAVALILLAFAPYARFVPRSALAGILMVTAVGMIDWKALPFHLRATRFDGFIVLTTAVAAVGVSVEFCILIGVLALLVARGVRAEVDQKGALAQVLAKPFGGWVVGLLAAGFACYALWRLSEAAFGVTGEGRRTGPRLQSLARALIYGFLAYTAVQLLLGSRTPQTAQQKGYAAEVMAHPGGRWAVGLVGLAVAVAGVVMVVEGLRLKFMRYFPAGAMDPSTRAWIRQLGRIGTVARGLVFALAGALVVSAAWTYQPAKASGLDGALRTLADRPLGNLYLTLAGIGLAIFGLYGLAEARYRRV